MDQMIIKTSELLYLQEASKALKQKNFQIINSCIMGIDNDAVVCYLDLDVNQFPVYSPIDGFVINTRELSAFIKTIMLESEFILEPAEFNSLKISTMNGIMYFRELPFELKNKMLANKLYSVKQMIHNFPLGCISREAEVTSKISELFSLKKDDGCIYYKHQDKYFMTLFSGLLPINKSDKVFISIFSGNTTTVFNAVFRVAKKKFNIYICIAYLYI